MFDGYTFGLVSPGVVHIPWIAGFEWVLPLLVIFSIALVVRFILQLIPIV